MKLYDIVVFTLCLFGLIFGMPVLLHYVTHLMGYVGQWWQYWGF